MYLHFQEKAGLYTGKEQNAFSRTFFTTKTRTTVRQACSPLKKLTAFGNQCTSFTERNLQYTFNLGLFWGEKNLLIEELKCPHPERQQKKQKSRNERTGFQAFRQADGDNPACLHESTGSQAFVQEGRLSYRKAGFLGDRHTDRQMTFL